MSATTIIFDLSEVLIAGLIGVEQPLALQLGLPADVVVAMLGGEPLHELLCARMTEDVYLRTIIDRYDWRIDASAVAAAIRANFHQEITGTRDIFQLLGKQHDLILLSDHAREWICYIEQAHPFLAACSHRFYSFELGSTKKEALTFSKVLTAIHRQPSTCVFIDDSEANVAVARSLGIDGIRFQGAKSLRASLRARGLIEKPIDARYDVKSSP